jgi:hypothetical protein
MKSLSSAVRLCPSVDVSAGELQRSLSVAFMCDNVLSFTMENPQKSGQEDK